MEEADNRRCVTICDLDGTLLTTNSFTQFVKWILLKNIVCAVPVATISLMRKLRFISHAKAKRLIISVAANNILKSHIDSWVDFMIFKYTNREVRNILHDQSMKGDLLLLATAAPRIYASVFGKRFGFDYTLATPDAGPENCCEEKAHRVKEWCLANNVRPVLFLTDHPDDLPTERFVRLSGGRIIHVQVPE